MKHCLTILTLSFCCAALSADGAVNYIADDGANNVNVGVGGSGGDLLVLNRFTVQPTGDGIVEIQVNWTGIASNFPAKVAVYDDPNDDGDLSDLVLLHESDVQTNSVGGNTYASYIIPNTFVSGDFYVGAYVENMAGNVFPFGYDTTDPDLPNTSYFFERTGAGDLSLSDPNGTATLQGWGENFIVAGNFMIRAVGDVGTPPVPEPGPVSLLVFGTVLMLRRRHH